MSQYSWNATRVGIKHQSINQSTIFEPFRINCLAAVSLLQAWMMWNFINFHLRRLRERSAVSRKIKSPAKKKINKSKFLVNVYNYTRLDIMLSD
jgi:hypothetical protein